MEKAKYLPERFGVVTKWCHWLVFFVVLLQYVLVYTEIGFPKEDPSKLQLILYHKSFGVIMLGLACIMLIARYFEGRPPYLIHPSLNATVQGYQNYLAKIVHILLYVCIFVMPLAGILMSLYGGRGVLVFGYSLFAPDFIVPNKWLSGVFYNIHVYVSYLLLGLIALHVTGVCYHKWVLRDKVLNRMW